jgi:hypothetical protein
MDAVSTPAKIFLEELLKDKHEAQEKIAAIIAELYGKYKVSHIEIEKHERGMTSGDVGVSIRLKIEI